MITSDASAFTLEAADLMDSVVSGVSVQDLRRRTPCRDWNLGDLLAHQVGQNYGMAAALIQGDAPLELYQPIAYSAAAWSDSRQQVRSAAGLGLSDGRVLQRELHGAPIPRARVWQALCLDFAVHAWDVAISRGLPLRPSRPLQNFVLSVAETIADSARGESGTPFAPLVRDPEPDAFTRVMHLCGRRPSAAMSTQGAS